MVNIYVSIGVGAVHRGQFPAKSWTIPSDPPGFERRTFSLQYPRKWGLFEKIMGNKRLD